jgi:hypothetical protein
MGHSTKDGKHYREKVLLHGRSPLLVQRPSCPAAAPAVGTGLWFRSVSVLSQGEDVKSGATFINGNKRSICENIGIPMENIQYDRTTVLGSWVLSSDLYDTGRIGIGCGKDRAEIEIMSKHDTVVLSCPR